MQQTVNKTKKERLPTCFLAETRRQRMYVKTRIRTCGAKR